MNTALRAHLVRTSQHPTVNSGTHAAATGTRRELRAEGAWVNAWLFAWVVFAWMWIPVNMHAHVPGYYALV